MKNFLDENFLLQNKTAQKLFHDFAKDMPIIDYHCHLPPQQLAEDHRFENLTQVWLYGDHYKWRAMRANGIDESYCTGNKSDREKFQQWAATVPYTLRNPLYHWTHLELQRYFDIHEILNSDSAEKIYSDCTEKLQSPEYFVQSLVQKMNVEIICTTDDPLDDLSYHRQLANENFITVLPAFRPDTAMNVNDPVNFNLYVSRLEAITDISVHSFSDYVQALKKRHDYFAANGCCVSDHGLEELYAEDFSVAEITAAFNKIRKGEKLNDLENRKLKSALLIQFAEWDYEKKWVQQYHLGALRNNNSRALRSLGADTGWDSVGDFSQGRSMSKFFDRLDNNNHLAKTILYNLNPADNELFATMVGNFNDGSVVGKMQWGSAWWFLDQKDGMTKQLNTLSNIGLLSRFVGMLTDSRSFLSYPRHEYFRRILCNLFGEEIEKGELPDDINWVGKVIQDISYYNAKNYFNWPAAKNENKSKTIHETH
jgi:Glucuronate isomerase